MLDSKINNNNVNFHAGLRHPLVPFFKENVQLINDLYALSRPDGSSNCRDSYLINYVKPIWVDVEPDAHEEINKHEKPAVANEVSLLVYLPYDVTRFLILRVYLQLLLSKTDKKHDCTEHY